MIPLTPFATSGVRFKKARTPPPQSRPRDFCGRGHPMVENNLYYSVTGYRNCRTCAKLRNKAYKARKKACPSTKFLVTFGKPTKWDKVVLKYTLRSK